MNTKQILLLGLGGAAIYYIVTHQNDVATAAQAAASDVEAYTMGWKNAGSGPQWVPILNQAEISYGLPQDILAATAYQECSFIENVIRGIKSSSAGALGILQMEPQFYAEVRVPVPFTDQDVSAQISRAGQVFASNYAVLGSWPLTIAAWNAGLGEIEKAGGIPPASMDPETGPYVANVLANAPAAAA